MRPITNLNSLLVKNYIPGSDTLAVIRELKKLGIIKGPKPKSKPKMIDDIKQDNEMVGYVKTLAGNTNSLSPNIFALKQIEAGMSKQQIEDIQRTNAAQVAALQSEVAQNRLENQATIGGLVGAASQRFAQISNVLGRIVNPETERFRSQQEAGAGIYDPMANLNPNVIRLGNEPDVRDVPMDQSLNEGGPVTKPEFATSTFPQEETGNIPTAPANLQPREKVGGGSSEKTKPVLVLDRQDVANELELGKIPTMRNSYTAIENFYIALTDAGIGDRDESLKSKGAILTEINALLEDAGKSILNN